MGKVIHWELCKKFKFDHTNKRYMLNQESVQENETHKILCNFVIQMDHLISARRPDLVVVVVNNNNKRKPVESWTLPFRITEEKRNGR